MGTRSFGMENKKEYHRIESGSSLDQYTLSHNTGLHLYSSTTESYKSFVSRGMVISWCFSHFCYTCNNSVF